MESQLRKDCQSLLKQLQKSQQLLNNDLAAQKLSEATYETVNHSENKDSQTLKSSYARNKLFSASKPFYEDDLKTVVTKPVRNDIVNNKENIYKQGGDIVFLQGTEEIQIPSRVTSHVDNNDSRSSVQTKEKDTYKHQTVTSSSWQPATPDTQRRRNLIDRHTCVPTKLNAEELRNLNRERMLNFSYSHVTPDDDDCIPCLYSENNCDSELHDNLDDRVSVFKSRDNLENAAKVFKSNDSLEDEVKAPKTSEEMNKQRVNPVPHVNKKDGHCDEETVDFKETQKTSDVQKPGISSVVHAFKSQLEDDGNNRRLNNFIKDTTIKPKSLLNSTSYSLHNLSASRRNNSGVRFDTSRNSQDSFADHRLLGYDWIAALLDNDSELVDQSESFFNELREFRRAYKDECSNEFYMAGPHTLVDFEPEPVVEALREPKVEPYIVNERLFTEPLHSGLIDYDESRQQRKGSKKEPTADNPRFVRVSIPRSTLQTPYRVKPHRRRSFDASDSCSLMSHCLLGWENAVPSVIPTAKSLDLKTAAGMSNGYQKTTLAEAEKLASTASRAQWAFDKPNPRLQLLPLWKKHYTDISLKMSLPPANDNSSISRSSAGSESVKRATDKLLNTAYATMYQMERLKEERRLENVMREKKK